MLEIGLCGKFLCTEISLFLYFTSIALWMCYKCRCNIYQNNQDLSLPSGSDILPTCWSCRASPIYDLPINLRYIHKRVPALAVSQKKWQICDGSRLHILSRTVAHHHCPPHQHHLSKISELCPPAWLVPSYYNTSTTTFIWCNQMLDMRSQSLKAPRHDCGDSGNLFISYSNLKSCDTSTSIVCSGTVI